MCSVNAGNNRIISNNFIKTQGKIGECVSTFPPGVPPHLFTPIAFNIKMRSEIQPLDPPYQL